MHSQYSILISSCYPWETISRAKAFKSSSRSTVIKTVGMIHCWGGKVQNWVLFLMDHHLGFCFASLREFNNALMSLGMEDELN
jgi:hypothetical protein